MARRFQSAPTHLFRMLMMLIWAAGAATVHADESAARPPPPADWFHIVRLDDRPHQLSEPKYWQQNVSYLLLGTRRGLLFDTGPGLYSIRSAVQKLTQLPLIV